MRNHKSYILAVITSAAALFCGCMKYNVNGTQTPLYAVTDGLNYRILFFSGYPGSNSLPQASLVLGQSDMYHNSANGGGAISASGLGGPKQVIVYGNSKVLVVDGVNNRILIWNQIPTQNGQNADVVLGQSNFSSGLANQGLPVSAQAFYSPFYSAIYGGSLFVPDYNNNRVLIWSTVPTVNNQPANIVVGQNAMNVVGFSTTQQSVGLPGGVVAVNGKLIVADRGNSRILIWNTIPTSNNAPASLVLGQPTFTASGCGTGQQSFCLTGSLCSDGVHLVLNDQFNARVIIWNSIPTQMNQPADLVLGQPNFTSSTPNNTPGAPGTVSAQSLSNPTGVSCGNGHLFVSDQNNNRILVWNSMPTQNQQAADLVIGQNSFSSANCCTIDGAHFNALGPASNNFDYFGVNNPQGY